MGSQLRTWRTLAVTLSERLLNPEILPSTLWNREGRYLCLPIEFASAYERLVDRYGLRALAISRTQEDSPTGGSGKEETEQHFAQQFDNSAARAQFALSNVTGDVVSASNALIRALSGNTICITDAPCGAGAATYALLCAIAELRAHSVLPRVRLDVCLIGGEISEHARKIASEMLSELRPYLESQAIFVEAEFHPWDVTCNLSTADLMNAASRASPMGSKRLVVVANFSGFLSLPGKLKTSRAQLEELFRYSSGSEHVAVWIEPQMNFAISGGGVFQSIARLAKDSWHRFARVIGIDGQGAPFIKSEVNFRSTLTPNRLRPIRLAVMRLDLERK